MYNLTNISTSNNIVDMAQAINGLSSGAFYGLFFLVIFLINLALFNKMDFKRLMLLDCYLMSVVGLFMMSLGLIGWPILILPVIGVFISIFLVIFVG